MRLAKAASGEVGGVKAEDLFHIETNVNFEWVPLSSHPDSRDEAVGQIARCYGISTTGRIFEMKKRNPGTRLFRIQDGNRHYVLRAAPLKEAGFLEQQCEILSRLASGKFLMPWRSCEGSFVVCFGDAAWILYPYLEGAVWDGAPSSLNILFSTAFGALEELKHDEPESGLLCAIHRNTMGFKLTQGFFQDQLFLQAPFDRLVSDKTAAMLRKWTGELAAQVQKSASLEVTDDVALTHNDMNHANFILTGSKAVLIDIEDLCFESVRIAAAHCIFKLVRHSVFTGAVNLTQARNRLLPAALDLAGKAAVGFSGVGDFRQYALFRIISDIEYILEKIQIRKAVPMPVDLEKKIHNLFELELLMN